jgi:hypothetical protein
MKTLDTIIFCSIICFFLSSCGEMKRISKGNYVYHYVDNQATRIKNPAADDSLYIYKLETAIKTKIEDKTDYLILKNKNAFKSLQPVDSISINPPVPAKVQMNGSYYSTESDRQEFEKYQKSFHYTDLKFAIQTLSIPLKFRKALDDGTKYPQQVETGVNIGFAPVIKYNFNVYNPTKKVMGKSLNQYSINTGLILNIGATDLKSASNAPGLKSDRKSPTFTYGTFLMFGINNINFGYAIGWDKIMGEGHSNWVYQDKLWHGIIIALDIIKP